MSWKTLGFKQNKDLFDSLLDKGELAHAYLFHGQDMIGKRTFAEELAGKVAGSGTDIFIIDKPDLSDVKDDEDSKDTTTVTIGDVRKIKNFLSLTASGGKHKVVIINDAHNMTDEAQNATLKILEEPTGDTVIMLITNNDEILLATIKSRCQDVHFKPHSKTDFDKSFTDANMSAEQRKFLFEFSNGRIGLIKRMLADDSFDEIKKNAEELMELIKAKLHDRLILTQDMVRSRSRDQLQKKVLYWILFMYTRTNDVKNYKLLKYLLELYDIISKQQFNHQLAFEVFVTKI
ncbi:MAG: hypothetical protein ABH833_01880 [Parcubacteria group bacterium]